MSKNIRIMMNEAMVGAMNRIIDHYHEAQQEPAITLTIRTFPVTAKRKTRLVHAHAKVTVTHHSSWVVEDKDDNRPNGDAFPEKEAGVDGP